MKSNELRIGNLVDIGQKEDIEEFGTDIHNVVVCEITRDGIVFKCESAATITAIKPIPLTEEWLLKFGFTEYGEWFSNDWFYNGLNVSLKHKKTTIGNREETEIEHTKHVHQLQNLYFALTGEELTIK